MKYLIANFKQNGDRKFYDSYLDYLQAHFKAEDSCVAVFCPPAPYLMFIGDSLRLHKINAYTCGQCISRYDSGAYTGGVSANMVADCGSKYALINHSEHHTATCKKIKDKIKQCLQAGLKVVLCVNDIKSLAALPKGIGNDDIIIAYEPVEAIGTGKQPTTSQINKAISQIKVALKQYINGDYPILYGGSVTPQNCINLIKSCKIDGFVVGSACLQPKNIVDIYNIISKN